MHPHLHGARGDAQAPVVERLGVRLHVQPQRRHHRHEALQQGEESHVGVVQLVERGHEHGQKERHEGGVAEGVADGVRHGPDHVDEDEGALDAVQRERALRLREYLRQVRRDVVGARDLDLRTTDAHVPATAGGMGGRGGWAGECSHRYGGAMAR